jgi:hypothetical protein
VISQPSAYSSTAPYFEAAFEAGFPETVGARDLFSSPTFGVT